MNTNIVARNFDLTDAIKDYIEKVFDNSLKYNLDISSFRVILLKEEKNKKITYRVEFIVNAANKNTFVINKQDKDLYAAIDLANDKLSKSLRRHSDKIKSHKAQKFSEAIVDEKKDEDEIEIVQVDLSSYKPTSIEEAIDELKNSDDIFKVFYDLDDSLRVVYKIGENRFGLY